MEINRNVLPNEIYLDEQSRPMEKILRCKFCGIEKSKNDWIQITVKYNSSFPDSLIEDTQKPPYYVWCPDCEDYRHLVYDFYEG